VIIIGLTAHARKEDEEACYEAGMNGFLTKPIIKDKLPRIMQEKTSR
jgi:CheY-like chemotaxis protein